MSKERVKKGLKSIAHRGPDGSGERWISCAGRDLWFGHTRLSILDRSDAGAQPMESHDGRWLISFNGEIYNHATIRDELTIEFRGQSDTETLVESLAAFGLSATLPKLNGMFAFAALDRKEGLLYLVRDPFGIKPLYICQRGRDLYFSSELRGLSAMGIALDVSEEGLDCFLSLRYVPSPQTLLKGIERLPPGHMLQFDLRSGESEVQPYIKACSDRFMGSFEDAVHQYKQELSAAVHRQLLSDVPVGLLLSGGIDSALIAALAKESGKKLTAFTVGFGREHSECEISDAEETAQILGLPHRGITIEPDQIWQSMPAIIGSVEEPLGTVSILPMWSLVARAREEVTVVLTGQGTDEPWGGYRRYQLELIRAKGRGWGAMGLIPTQTLNNWLPRHLSRGLRSISVSSVPQRFLATYELFTHEQRRALTGRGGYGSALHSIEKWLDWQSMPEISLAEQMMRVDSRMNLADDLLLYGDKMSMAVSLEARVPMLDIQLMNFVESLPLKYRVTLKETKRVHKAMAEQLLPSSIVHRPKKGFQVPFGEWSRGIWKDRVAEQLLEPGRPHLNYLNRSAIERLWQAHLKGRPDYSRALFALLNCAMWTEWVEGQNLTLSA